MQVTPATIEQVKAEAEMGDHQGLTKTLMSTVGKPSTFHHQNYL